MGIEIMKNGDVVPVWKVPELIETLESEIGRLHVENEWLKTEDRRLKDAIYAIVSTLLTNRPQDALILAKTVMHGGSVNNPLDIAKYGSATSKMDE